MKKKYMSNAIVTGKQKTSIMTKIVNSKMLKYILVSVGMIACLYKISRLQK